MFTRTTQSVMQDAFYHSLRTPLPFSRRARKVLLTLLMTTLASLAQAKFTASVEQTTIASHDVLELTLRTDQSSNDAPDLAPLNWSFEVLGTRQESRTSIINGKQEYVRDWVISLLPKKEGVLVIPPIQLGNQQSAPITITVSDKKTADTPSNPLQMKASVSSNSVYVQQELILTLNIMFRIELYDQNRLSALNIGNALVQQLGETRKFETIVDGVRYQGFELKYSIHPQAIGEMIIPALTFTGVAVEPRQQFNSFFSQNGKPVLARSQEIRVDVKPKPDNYPASTAWLPARNLTLTQKWSQSPHSLQVGDAITRTITLQADGLTAVQLTPILVPQPKGVNSYPDQSDTEDRDTDQGIQGQRTDSIAMIPSRPGKITLPAITYTWFDTEKGSVQTARLPATEIEVLPNPTTPPAVPPLASDKTVECPPTINETPVEATTTSTHLWQALSALFALLWFITLWWGWRRGGKTPQSLTKPEKPTNEAAAFNKLEAACKQQDVSLTLLELKNWCRLFYNNDQLASLTECLQLLSSQTLVDACNALNSGLYASTAETVDQQALLNSILEQCRIIRAQQITNPVQPVATLYPN